MVVMQDECGSGGSLTRVMMPGTTSEKYRDTKVDIRDDFPQPSDDKINKKQEKIVSASVIIRQTKITNERKKIALFNLL